MMTKPLDATSCPKELLDLEEDEIDEFLAAEAIKRLITEESFPYDAVCIKLLEDPTD
jgi:hypothetical protein